LVASDRITTLTGLNRRGNLLAYITAKTRKRLGPGVQIDHPKSGSFLLFCSGFTVDMICEGSKDSEAPDLFSTKWAALVENKCLLLSEHSHTHTKKRIFFE